MPFRFKVPHSKYCLPPTSGIEQDENLLWLALSDSLNQNRFGGHPWEIYRGGNSTHINLFVREDKTQNNFIVGLEAFASSRMLETCRIALAFDKANLPFELSHKKSYLKRLLMEDWIGIVSKETSIKYAWHDFPEKWNVADCIHFEWLFEDRKDKAGLKRKLTKIVSWVPEPITCTLKS